MKIRIRLLALLSVLAAATGLAIAATVPALAAYDRGTECEVSHPVCIGAPSLVWGASVQETSSGRTLDVIPTTDPLYANVYKLRFHADTTKCVGIDTTGNLRAIVKNCDNTAIVWQRLQTGSGDNHRWMNVYESRTPGPHGGTKECLTGYGSAGLTMFINPCGSGIQVFDFSGVTIT
jgi:hypothetical protein